METIENAETQGQQLPHKKDKQFVYTIRDWKEYLGESFLIIFSVLLALILTEFFNSLHEKENTRNTLKNIVEELRHNKKAIGEMKEYNSLVLTKIDSALTQKGLQDSLVSKNTASMNGYFIWRSTSQIPTMTPASRQRINCPEI